VFAGAGTTAIDSSTLFLNNYAVDASAGGIIRVSNNNIYNNKAAYICNGTSGIVQSAGNNRLASNTGSTAATCSTVGSIPLG
jgi:hypothetical protein